MSVLFDTKVRRIGNSLGVIIPRRCIDELGLTDGDNVSVAIPSVKLARRNSLLLELAGIDKDAEPFSREKEDRV